MTSKQKQKQKGQALPIGIAAIMFVTLLSLLVFNTSQTTSEKMRLTNTADAAAYSGMIWQARALNYYSYTNRAMVANQVSIAQIVSFASWTSYLKVTSFNLNALLGWIPIVGGFTNAFQLAAFKIDGFLQWFAAWVVPALSGWLKILSGTQKAVHVVSVVATVDIVNKVVKLNDPSYTVSTANSAAAFADNTYNWFDMTKIYDSNAGLQRKADMAMRSRDRWTRDRGWVFNDIPPLPLPGGIDKKALSVNGVTIVEVVIVKEGTTRLIGQGDLTSTTSQDAKWMWKGKDTLSAHLSYPCWKTKKVLFGSIQVPGNCKKEIPVGWGAAFASTTNIDLDNCVGIICQQQDWFARNKLAEDNINSYNTNVISGYKGLNSYREIRDLSEKNKDPRHSLAIEVRKPGGTRTSSKIAGLGSPTDAQPGQSRNGIQKGMFSMPDNLATDGISAIGKAEVYFRRPVELSGNRVEYGNLYNPYWDVHLIDAKNERFIAWSLALGIGQEGSGGGMF